MSQIKLGNFQGESLFPLVIFFSIDPIKFDLKKINHLLYMDDLK